MRTIAPPAGPTHSPEPMQSRESMSMRMWTMVPAGGAA
jgi:hypothetical protein